MATNFYIALIVMRDHETQDITGLARPVLAESPEAALNETLADLRRLAPETSEMEIKVQDVREIPREFLEQAAQEVLGWNTPEEAQRGSS